MTGITLPENAEVTPVSVSYEPTDYGDMAIALEQSNLLDDMENYAQTNFDWPEPLNFVASECGEANAFWDPETRTLTLCYEILEDWSEIEHALVDG